MSQNIDEIKAVVATIKDGVVATGVKVDKIDLTLDAVLARIQALIDAGNGATPQEIAELKAAAVEVSDLVAGLAQHADAVSSEADSLVPQP